MLGLESWGNWSTHNQINDLKKRGDKGVLIKASKYNQSNILDIPTIGAQTLKLLIENDYEGVFIEKNHCLIIDQDEVINLANTNNLFISTFEKLWLKTRKYLLCCKAIRRKYCFNIVKLKKYNYQIDGVVGAIWKIRNNKYLILVFLNARLIEIFLIQI